MLSKILLPLAIFCLTSLVEAYNYAPPAAYNSNFGTPYAAPLPVASFKGHFPYNALSYAAPSFVKLRGSGDVGFRCGPSLRSRPKFDIPAPVPAVYDAPWPVDDGSSDVIYNDFEAPNIVVKFGPAITTTTTTHSTSAAAAASVHKRTLFKAANGW